MSDVTRPGPPRDDAVVVLDAGHAEDLLRDLRRQLASLLDDPPSAVVVDLSRLGHLSSGAVSALLWARGACRPRGVPVRLRNVPPGGVATLRRTGLGAALSLDSPPRGAGGRA